MTLARPTGEQGEDETMNSRTIRILMSGLFVALAVSAVLASSAGASPAWKFSGVELKSGETEVTVGFGVESSLTVPGAPVVCEHFLYRMTISNSGGTGQGEVTELPLFKCTTTAKECIVEAVGAEELPWPAHLTAGKGGNYVVIENVEIGILYGGALCPLNGVLVTVTGSAGALFENGPEAAAFSEASFIATTTALEALGSSVQLEGVFPTEAFEWNREQALAVS
jgi:hypothetical protein